MNRDSSDVKAILRKIIGHRPYATRFGNILFLFAIALGIYMAYVEGIFVGVIGISIYGTGIFALEWLGGHHRGEILG